MKRTRQIFLILLIAAALLAVFLLAEGERVTPAGSGTVTLDSGTFEAFPLPEYASQHLSPDYKSYFVEVEPGIKIHVLEVGTGYPIFLQHGNPTSGFLYRKVAQALPTDRVRLIMPTLVGLGFSSKVPVSEHTLDNHVRWINGVLSQLQLEELVYVGQDWGGPIGMGALAASPNLLRGAVLLNTGFTAPKGPMELSKAHAAVRTPIVGELMINVITSIFESLPNVQGDPNSIPPSIQELYGKPVLDSGNAKAPLALMRMVPDGVDHPSVPGQRRVESYVRSLDIPAEIIWGMNDPILAKGLPAMAAFFPDAPVTETQAGHFLQEEVPDVIAAALVRVVDQLQDATVPSGETP